MWEGVCKLCLLRISWGMQWKRCRCTLWLIGRHQPVEPQRPASARARQDGSLMNRWRRSGKWERKASRRMSAIHHCHGLVTSLHLHHSATLFSFPPSSSISMAAFLTAFICLPDRFFFCPHPTHFLISICWLVLKIDLSCSVILLTSRETPVALLNSQRGDPKLLFALFFENQLK